MKCSKDGFSCTTIKQMGAHYRSAHPSAMKRRGSKKSKHSVRVYQGGKSAKLDRLTVNQILALIAMLKALLAEKKPRKKKGRK